MGSDVRIQLPVAAEVITFIRQRMPMNAILRVTHKNKKEQVCPLKPTTNIGRRTGADICIESSEVSRDHCVIFLRRDHWYVKDLGSTNGTCVNDKMISEQLLDSGDCIEIGPVRLVFERTGSPVGSQGLPESEGVEGVAEAMQEELIPLAESDSEVALPIRIETEDGADNQGADSQNSEDEEEDDELEEFFTRLRDK